MNRVELEERLINFAVLGIEISRSMPKNDPGRHFSDQLLRSSSSPALNYGESQSAESRKDFTHKVSIILKELRETQVCLTIIERASISSNPSLVAKARTECNELVSIFVKTVKSMLDNTYKR